MSSPAHAVPSMLEVSKLRYILATDCGSTTTKAILVERRGEGSAADAGSWHQTQRAEAPTTVEEPFADVTIGVSNALTEIGELAGRRFIADDGTIIRRSHEGDPNGCDLYISTSSAGGGLQMVVAGVVAQMTAASAKRAALGAGAIVMDTIAANDKRKPHERIQRIRELRPDMVLISGGTDGGNVQQVVQIAEQIAPAKPRPRFGGEYELPVIFAGNADAAPQVRAIFGARGEKGFDLAVVQNLRPTLEQENLGPARDKIHDVFLEHVMAHAPGYDRLMSWSDAPIMPTPGAVGDILQRIAARDGLNAVCVDIGGATTDVFSVFGGVFNRTVSANLGMSYSISNVCAEAGMENVLRWVPIEMDERELRNRVKNKMIRPTTIPQTAEALVFEQAVAREALRLAYVQHKEFATTLKGVQQQRTVGDLFSQQASGQSIVNDMTLDLLVASGGVLSHAPRVEQTASMLIDSFEPQGFTQLAKDSIFMMPHLGVLASVHAPAAMEVFERDCLVRLGWCVAATSAAGTASRHWGKKCFTYRVSGAVSASGELTCGEVALVRVGIDQEVEVVVEPTKEFDLGAGFGKSVVRRLKGGSAGIFFDARGRPLMLPEKEADRKAAVARWDAVWST